MRITILHKRMNVRLKEIINKNYKKYALTHVRFNPSSPHSDENEFSLYTITTFSNIQVMRIKEAVTKDKMS